MKKVESMDPSLGLALIDIDTGEVLGLNVRLVHIPHYMADAVNSSPHEAKVWAMNTGSSLMVDLDESSSSVQAFGSL